MSGALPQPPAAPPPSALQGATAGMAPPGGAGGANALQAKFQTVVSGAREIIQALSKVPSVDQAKLQQAVQSLQQGIHMIAEAVQGGGKPPAS